MLNEYVNYLYNYDAQASGLLGNFDAQNNYSIQDELKAELLKANKLISDFKEDLIDCYAMVGAYKFEFKVLIQEGEGHKKRAGLFLIEKASQGFYEQEISEYSYGHRYASRRSCRFQRVRARCYR